MKIIYRFDDGKISEVEVDEMLGLTISAMERETENYERKCRYWNIMRIDYDGAAVADYDTPALYVERKEELKKIDEFFKLLTPIQRRRLLIRYDDPSISLREIARMEGVDIKTIRECFEAIQKKYLKFFKK